MSSAETGDTVLKLQLKSSHFEMGPGSKISESTLEVNNITINMC